MTYKDQFKNYLGKYLWLKIPNPDREVAFGAGGSNHPNCREFEEAAALMEIPQLRSHRSRRKNVRAITAIHKSFFHIAHGPSR